MGYDCYVTISADKLTEHQAEDLYIALALETKDFQGFYPEDIDFASHAASWSICATGDFDSVHERVLITRMEELSEAFNVTLTLYYRTDDPTDTATIHVGPQARAFEVQDLALQLQDLRNQFRKYTVADVDAANLDDDRYKLVMNFVRSNTL